MICATIIIYSRMRSGRKWVAPSSGQHLPALQKQQQQRKQQQHLLHQRNLGMEGTLMLLKSDPQGASMQLVFSVVSVFRYMVDTSYKQSMNIDGLDEYANLKHVYDVVVSDGRNSLKVHIHPSLNELADTGHLYTGAALVVSSWVCWYDASMSNTGGAVPSFTIITQFARHEQSPAFSLTAAAHQTPWLPQSSHWEQDNGVPLYGRRGYYVEQFSDGSILGHPDQKQSMLYNGLDEDIVSVDAIQQAPFLGEAATAFLSNKRRKARSAASTGFLYGRIIKKSAINHYASKNDSNLSTWPMSTTFYISDDSATLRVVAWNALAPRLYASLSIGDIVALNNYRIKRAYYEHPLGTHSGPSLNNLSAPPPEQVELALNPSNPSALVYRIVDSEDDPDAPRVHPLFPLLENNVYPLQRISKLNDGLLVDVFGIVVFVGRVQCQRTEHKQGTGWFTKECYRWITICDETLTRINIKVYVNTQWSLFINEIKLGKMIFLKELRVASITPSARPSDRILWLHSTPYTRLFMIVADPTFDEHLGGHAVQFYLDNKQRIDTLVEFVQHLHTEYSDNVYYDTWCVSPVGIPHQLFIAAFPNIPNLLLAQVDPMREALHLLESRDSFLRCRLRSVEWLDSVPTYELDAESEGALRTRYHGVVRLTVCSLNDAEQQISVTTSFENHEYGGEATSAHCASALLHMLEAAGMPQDALQGITTCKHISASGILEANSVHLAGLLQCYRYSADGVESVLTITQVTKR